MGCGCMGMCGRCFAAKKVVLGALVLLNIYVWPKWTGSWDKWIAFFAALMILAGIVKFFVPCCPHAKEAAPAPAKKGR